MNQRLHKFYNLSYTSNIQNYKYRKKKKAFKSISFLIYPITSYKLQGLYKYRMKFYFYQYRFCQDWDLICFCKHRGARDWKREETGKRRGEEKKKGGREQGERSEDEKNGEEKVEFQVEVKW